ncbi:MAG TPA: UMP kinase [Candidatus Magasanikbacteria bacterium]|nr:UMP kinase [Candidatus Magasanikbacteria bacterium]
MSSKKSSKYKIISVGGSIIIPKTGFDINFLKKFRELILARVKKGEKFILVIGGGATCRAYQEALAKTVKTSNENLDWLGIYTTIFNAQFVRLLFGDYAYEEVVSYPKEKVKTTKSIIVASGWKPNSSSDYDAVELTKAYGAGEVINLSNISHVYTKDPKKYKDAEKIEKISWKNFRKNIIGNIWKPGANAPFDPKASRIAEKAGLRVVVLDGNNLKEVEKVLKGEKFNGTIIA